MILSLFPCRYHCNASHSTFYSPYTNLFQFLSKISHPSLKSQPLTPQMYTTASATAVSISSPALCKSLSDNILSSGTTLITSSRCPMCFELTVVLNEKYTSLG